MAHRRLIGLDEIVARALIVAAVCCLRFGTVPGERDAQQLWDEVLAIGSRSGLDRMGVAPATVMTRARAALDARRAAGLADTMQFTYRNPARSTDPSRSVPGAQSLIVAARSYVLAGPEPPAPGSGPTARVARYAWVDHYGALRAGLEEVARHLRGGGHRAMVFADDNAIVDREAAYRAGIGWFGKNANLLVAGLGSYVVLGSVVTTAALGPAPAPAPDGCGQCDQCRPACPTGAIVAPGVVDARRCLAWVLQKPGSIPLELRPAVGDRIYGCDDCQEACPITVRLAPRVAVHRSQAGEVHAAVAVLDLLDADDDTLLARHGRWYIAGRDPRWLRRNALVVLGNSGQGADRRVQATLRRYARGADPVLAEHARWAQSRLAAA